MSSGEDVLASDLEDVDEVLLLPHRQRSASTPVHIPDEDDPDRPRCQGFGGTSKVGEEYLRREPSQVPGRRLCRNCNPDYDTSNSGAGQGHYHSLLAAAEAGDEEIGGLNG